MSIISSIDFILRPHWLPQLNEFGPPVLHIFRQTLFQGFRQVRSGRYKETTVVDKSIFKRVPECQGARRICEAAASVLMGVDTAADVCGFGDELTLCYERNGVV